MTEIKVLLEKLVISQVPHSQLHDAAFDASMFLVPQPNGTYRPILNVFSLNVYIQCPHFKMETVQLVRVAIRTSD